MKRVLVCVDLSHVSTDLGGAVLEGTYRVVTQPLYSLI